MLFVFEMILMYLVIYNFLISFKVNNSFYFQYYKHIVMSVEKLIQKVCDTFWY